MIESTYYIIALGAALAALSILASLLSARVGAPLLLVFLLVGMLAGEEGIGGIEFNDFGMAFLVGNLALAIILLDGGLRTQRSTFRVSFAPALSLASLGVVITAGVVGAAAAWTLGWPWQEGFLVGAIVGSTDAAAVFGLLHNAGLELKQRSSATLEIESGANDPMAIFLTITLVTYLSQDESSSNWLLAGQFMQQLGLGAIMGLGGGWGLARLVNRLTLPVALYPILVIACGLLLFSLTNLWGGSGFLAIYILGLMLANTPLNHAHDIRRFHDGMAWFSQIGMFLILGLLVTPSNLLKVIVPGLILAAVLMFIARPIAVLICLAPFRFPWREQVFISWVGLKGAVPILLALYPYLSGLENADIYFELTFFMVLLSLCLQGWTIAPLARLMRLELPPKQEADFQTLSLHVPDHPGCELVTYKVHAGSAAEAYELSKLPLAEGTRLLGVVRGDEVVKLEPSLHLKPDDYLILLARSHALSDLAPLFQKIPTAAQFRSNEFFGQFSLKPETPLRDIAEIYGIPVPPEQQGLTLAEIFNRRYHGKPVIGDRVHIDNVELVVRQMVEGRIVQIGFKILPSRKSAPA